MSGLAAEGCSSLFQFWRSFSLRCFWNISGSHHENQRGGKCEICGKKLVEGLHDPSQRICLSCEIWATEFIRILIEKK